MGLLPSIRFESAAIECRSGDLFVLASDGILEVINGNGDEFGLVRLGEVIRRTAAKPLPEIYEAVTEAVRQHGSQNDDQTLLLARVP